MPMIEPNEIAKAAIETQADFVATSPLAIVRRLFAQKRKDIVLPNSDILNPAVVSALRHSLEGYGYSIEEMNAEFIMFKKDAIKDGSYDNHVWTLANPWMPPKWRAPRFGMDTQHNARHNTAMEQLRDTILQDWNDLKRPPMDNVQLRMYMVGMAANAVANLEVPHDEKEFDGDE